MEIKTKELHELLRERLNQEPSYPLILFHDYKTIIKPRAEIIKMQKLYLPLHEMLGWTDAEFCEKMKTNVETLKKLMPKDYEDSEYDPVSFVKIMNKSDTPADQEKEKEENVEISENEEIQEDEEIENEITKKA